jgi:hypothetical protein
MSSGGITLILLEDYIFLEYVYTHYTREERNEVCVCSVYTPKRHIQVYFLNNTSTLFVL